MIRLTPSLAAWVLSSLMALGVAASVYRIPIQVSDSLEIMEDTDRTASMAGAFARGLHASRTMLRPLRQVQTKALLEAAHALGERYNLVFRGYHAVTAVALILLFTYAAHRRTWVDVAALGFSLTVLTGLHTFAGMMTEAYPVNHFLLISLYCLATFVLAQSRGGVLVDIAATVCFALAVLTLESGLLVWVIAVAGYLAGLRGISRRAIVAITVVGVAYVGLRGFLDMVPSSLGDRQTGFGLGVLTVDDERARFGKRPMWLYAYTVLASALTVPLSQPSVGAWTAVQAWQTGRFAPVYAIEIGTSMAASLLIAWYVYGRQAAAAPRPWRTPLSIVTLAVLIANAGISYAYAKNEIMSVTGVFYALLVCAAARDSLTRLTSRPFSMTALPLIVVTLLLSGSWAFRALGLQHKLQRAEYRSRTEWVENMPPYRAAAVRDLRLAPRLRQEALVRGRANPFLLPAWAVAYWGEE